MQLTRKYRKVAILLAVVAVLAVGITWWITRPNVAVRRLQGVAISGFTRTGDVDIKAVVTDIGDDGPNAGAYYFGPKVPDGEMPKIVAAGSSMLQPVRERPDQVDYFQFILVGEWAGDQCGLSVDRATAHTPDAAWHLTPQQAQQYTDHAADVLRVLVLCKQ